MADYDLGDLAVDDADSPAFQTLVHGSTCIGQLGDQSWHHCRDHCRTGRLSYHAALCTRRFALAFQVINQACKVQILADLAETIDVTASVPIPKEKGTYVWTG